MKEKTTTGMLKELGFKKAQTVFHSAGSKSVMTKDAIKVFYRGTEACVAVNDVRRFTTSQPELEGLVHKLLSASDPEQALRELFCVSCWNEGEPEDGCEIFVCSGTCSDDLDVMVLEAVEKGYKDELFAALKQKSDAQQVLGCLILRHRTGGAR